MLIRTGRPIEDVSKLERPQLLKTVADLQLKQPEEAAMADPSGPRGYAVARESWLSKRENLRSCTEGEDEKKKRERKEAAEKQERKRKEAFERPRYEGEKKERERKEAAEKQERERKEAFERQRYEEEKQERRERKLPRSRKGR